MARTDIITGSYFSTVSFLLKSRQELSRQANGVTIGKDFGSALWVATFTTIANLNLDSVTYEALLNSLDGVISPFDAGDLRRPYPLLHQDGVFSDTGKLHAVNADNKHMQLDTLPAGFVLSVGDYLSFDYGSSRALHQVVVGATADGSGLTPEFEVRPHIRPGYTLAAAVTLKNPRAEMILVPDSLATQSNTNIDTVVTFQAVQYLS